MAVHRIECPIWATPALKWDGNNKYGNLIFSPRTAGRFFYFWDADQKIPAFDEKQKAQLTSWICDQRKFGNDAPEVTAEIVGNISNQRPLPVNERFSRALLHLESLQMHIGDTIKIPTNDQSDTIEIIENERPVEGRDYFFPRFFSATESTKKAEIWQLLAMLEHAGFIEKRETTDFVEFLITIDGYNEIRRLENAQPLATQAFVAMWFDTSMNQAFDDGIAPGIRDAGYEPVRVDQTEFEGKIDDQIIAEIRRSRFLVADFTQGEPGARGGVYYEAGFAHGLNIPVIFTCRADAINKVHFDTRQYNHIKWETPEELRERLANRISAVIGDGSLKPQS